MTRGWIIDSIFFLGEPLTETNHKKIFSVSRVHTMSINIISYQTLFNITLCELFSIFKTFNIWFPILIHSKGSNMNGIEQYDNVVAFGFVIDIPQERQTFFFQSMYI